MASSNPGVKTELVICAFLALGGFLLFAYNARPIPAQLLQIEGKIISRTPIYGNGDLTGFRFCIDHPRLTFTYSNPDPRVNSMWSGINNAARARVTYSSSAHANPRLWGLALDGYESTKPDEIHLARLKDSLVWLAMSLIALLYGYYAWRKARRALPNNSFKPNPLR